MAEGGSDPTDPTTDTTPLIPKPGDDDDDDATKLTHGIAATSTKFPSQKTQPMTPTARNPLNQAPLPPHLVNKYLWPQEQGSPKSAGISSPKPLSAVSQQNAWHGVRLNRSSRWLTKANLRHVTKRNPEQGVVVAL